MTDIATMDAVVDALVEISEIDRDEAQPDKHIFTDLGVDSLDFLDITFEIDRALGIHMPIEQWLSEAQEDPELGKSMFILGNFATMIDEVRQHGKV